MTLIKKVVLLFIFFITFVVYSVYSFDYDLQMDKQTNFTPLNVEKNDFGLIDKIINIFDSVNDEETKPFSLVLTKKDDVVIMDGIFANEEDSKKVFNFLNINRDGEYTYEENVVVDEFLLSKIVTLVASFKDFFANDSKLSIINDEIFLTGELKDPNQYALLETIISRTDLNIVKDIKIANPTLVDEKNNDNISDTKLSLNDIQQMLNQILSEKKISFERRSSTVTQDSQLTLDKIAKILNENINIRVEIAGHTDSRGEDALNKKISQDRANSVKDVLVSLGVAKDRLIAIGYGEEFPIAQDDENGLSEINRRVEFNIIGE
jgi:outer membrane protein OmpA-like peptidoglycan-associated protein